MQYSSHQMQRWKFLDYCKLRTWQQIWGLYWYCGFCANVCAACGDQWGMQKIYCYCFNDCSLNICLLCHRITVEFLSTNCSHIQGLAQSCGIMWNWLWNAGTNNIRLTVKQVYQMDMVRFHLQQNFISNSEVIKFLFCFARLLKFLFLYFIYQLSYLKGLPNIVKLHTPIILIRNGGEQLQNPTRWCKGDYYLRHMSAAIHRPSWAVLQSHLLSSLPQRLPEF